ncbi:MAG: hypothetical protein JNJ46_31150 [Myxococcales bacterium]|nr:hypothetical protein [Myxococcales bacterium]
MLSIELQNISIYPLWRQFVRYRAPLARVLLAVMVLVAMNCGGQPPSPGPSGSPNPSPSPNSSVYDCCTKDAEYYACGSTDDASQCVRGFTSACTRDATKEAAKCGKKVGDSCEKNSDCHDNICVFRGGASIGICSRQCSSTFDCPFPSRNWDCDLASGVSMKVCLPKQ